MEADDGRRDFRAPALKVATFTVLAVMSEDGDKINSRRTLTAELVSDFLVCQIDFKIGIRQKIRLSTA